MAKVLILLIEINNQDGNRSSFCSNLFDRMRAKINIMNAKPSVLISLFNSLL